MNIYSIKEQAVPFGTACFSKYFKEIVIYIKDIDADNALILLDDIELSTKKDNLYDLTAYKSYLLERISNSKELFTKIRHIAYKTAYDTGYFKDLNCTHYKFISKYISANFSYKDMLLIDTFQIMKSITSHYTYDTLNLIKKYYNKHLTDEFFIGYYIYLYKHNAYTELKYMTNVSDDVLYTIGDYIYLNSLDNNTTI